jgi:hypothetical protein
MDIILRLIDMGRFVPQLTKYVGVRIELAEPLYDAWGEGIIAIACLPISVSRREPRLEGDNIAL